VRNSAHGGALKDPQDTADADAVDTGHRANPLRAPSADTRHLDRSVRCTACTLFAAALMLGQGLLAPAAAPARQQRPSRSSAAEETVATPAIESSRVTAREERRARAGRRCHVAISVTPRDLTAGESATVRGSVTCPIAAEDAEQPVTLYQRTNATPGFLAAGTTTTEADGAFRLATEAVATDSTFYASSQGARSARAAVTVTPVVTISGPPADTQLAVASRSDVSARAADTLTFTGTVSPHDAGARVVLQRESASISENWHRIGFGVVGLDGTYSISHTFAAAGSATVRVVIRGGGLRAVASEPLTYVIPQRQNPRLTIRASAEGLSYGQSVILSGTASAAPDQLLTLLERTPARGFAPVAHARTDGAGNYQFGAVSPLRDTVYRVSGNGVSSARLLEAVKPLLTAEVSAASIPEDQPLRFSGTLTPAHAGQLVYLQRQNVSGIGFHVVDVTTLSAGGAYSLEHSLSGAGTQVFRVKVPGGPESQTVASAPFKITVTAAVPGPLEVEAPVESGPGEA
jgi:hypothetical protein